jgi:hypothetical protein
MSKKDKDKKPSLSSTIKSSGKTITTKELKQIEKSYGSKAVEKAKTYAQTTKGVSFSPGAKTYYKETKAPKPIDLPQTPQENYTPTTVIQYGAVPPGYMSREEYEAAMAGMMEALRGSLDLEKQQAAGASNVRVAEIQASAARYGFDRDVEAKKYLADQDLLKGTRVAEIEGKNRIDLQAIINSGLKEVETERQRGEKDIARIGSQSSFRNALIGAFNF